MKLRLALVPSLIWFYSLAFCPSTAAQPPAPFKTVVYIPVGVVEQMKDPAWLARTWTTISSQVHVDKVYIETYRSRVLADDQLIESVKQFFRDRHVEIAGGICLSDNDNGQFASFVYTRPADREYVKQVAALTARHFDDIILDDFFFANTKAPSDIAARGDETWTAFRLRTMDEVSRTLVVGATKEANPKAQVTIKFPNWYEHFAGNGYDLDEEPKIFGNIYAGTETRDPVITDQNLQQYEGFNIVRYFEHISRGHMGGGWVDTYDLRYIDRYSEQLWLTVFARAHEMTLFQYSDLLRDAPPGDRPWADTPTAVNWASVTRRGAGKPIYATVAGDALDQVKPIVAQLGTPIGIASYRPYNALGEDFLHNFIGMIGIPIDLYPTFPKDARVVFLTEAAKGDPHIVADIKQQLTDGKNVVITSGLLRALEGKGIEDLVELRPSTLPVPVTSFIGAFGPGAGTDLGAADKPILFPQIRFFTNDAWPVIRGVADDNAFPILIMDKYAAGNLFILNVPDNFTDLYRLPAPTLNALRAYILGAFPVRLLAPSKIALFPYDNGSLVVESFRDESTPVTILANAGHLRNLQTGERIEGAVLHPGESGAPPQATGGLAKLAYRITLPAHSFVAFAQEK